MNFNLVDESFDREDKVNAVERTQTRPCCYGEVLSNCNDLSSDHRSYALTNSGNITLSSSSDVHFGNKIVYNSPVTIKQLVCFQGRESGCVNSLQEHDLNTYTVGKNHVSEGSAACCGCSLEERSQTKDSRPVEQTNQLSLKDYLNNHYIILGVLVLLVVVAVILTVFILRNGNKEKSSSVSSRNIPHEIVLGMPTDANFTLSGKLHIKERIDWLAQPATDLRAKLQTPVPYVIISHTATEGCTLIAECVLLVRNIQTFHMESKHWSDIGYNFLAGGDGFAYTGRGWNYVGAHTYGFNNISIGISFMGTFSTGLPPARQITAVKQLIELGVKLGKISDDYKLLAHRQFSGSESPGTALYRELKTWPHWVPEP